MKNYYTIMQKNTDRCYRCKHEAVHWHHVLHGADKDLSEEHGLMVHLCLECHELVHHVDGKLDRELKERGQRDYLIKIFGRSYL